MKPHVLVVGGGVMGCATAYHLAQLGCRVTLLEQFGIANSHGSSHGRSRMLRLSYTSGHYIRAARISLALWHDFERRIGRSLFTRTGSLEISSRGDSNLAEMYARMLEEGVTAEQLDANQIQQRWPQFSLSDDSVGLFQADGGVLDAESCVGLLAAAAMDLGAEFHIGITARGLAPLRGGVRVLTDGVDYIADRVVVCAGAWTRQLLQPLVDIPIFVSIEQVAWFEARVRGLFAASDFPIFVHYDGTSRRRSGIPTGYDTSVKLMLERKEIGAADAVDATRLDELRAAVGAFIPEIRSATIVDTQLCRYTMTPDEDFIIDTLPQCDRVVIASPCSGHGFKFAILLGRYLADLALGIRPKGIETFSIHRFARS